MEDAIRMTDDQAGADPVAEATTVAPPSSAPEDLTELRLRLHRNGYRPIPVLGAHKGYTRTHQVIADVRGFGGGLDVAHLLARANIVTNKNLLPGDTPDDWDRPSGLRMGTIEVTRYGMREAEMDLIADFMARVLVEKQSPDLVMEDVIEFREGYQTLFYDFDLGLPPQ